MAINGVNGGGFNPYANGIGATRGANVQPGGTPPRSVTPQPASNAPVANGRSIADAIKQDASSRAAQLNSAQAPEGVDQDLWSILSKDERQFFLKAGAMGPLTYGRFSSPQAPAPAPMLRGGRLDIKA
jgi:hypothetical protein